MMSYPVRIEDLFSVEQYRKLETAYNSSEEFRHQHWALADILGPMLPDLEEKLGQENDADYLAYLLMYHFSRS